MTNDTSLHGRHTTDFDSRIQKSMAMQVVCRMLAKILYYLQVASRKTSCADMLPVLATASRHFHYAMLRSLQTQLAAISSRA